MFYRSLILFSQNQILTVCFNSITFLNHLVKWKKLLKNKCITVSHFNFLENTEFSDTILLIDREFHRVNNALKGNPKLNAWELILGDGHLLYPKKSVYKEEWNYRFQKYSEWNLK